jgi:phosphomannomutase/phosphoglucomutase
MVTASHNPPQYNGVKMAFGGIPADSAAVQILRKRIREGNASSGSGGYRCQDAIAPYLSFVEQDITLARPLKLAIDCGNATASAVAPSLFRALGCDLIELNCALDAGLAEQYSDPSQPEDTRDLGHLVRSHGADIGLAFDADGDRLGVVDSQGQFIPADRVLMVLVVDVLTRHPGSDVVYDVKCSRHLTDEIRRAGGRPMMVSSGHSPLKAKARESGAQIAGELSGHIVFKDRWFGFDDALYAGARLLEVLALDPRTTHEVFAALPGGLVTPELSLPLPEGEPARVMQRVMQLADRLDGVETIRIDGLRAELDRGWGLVRASNTESKLVFRFEGDDQEDLNKVQALYRRLMDQAAPGLSLPF